MSYRRSSDAKFSSFFLLVAIGLGLLGILNMPGFALGRIAFIPQQASTTTTSTTTNGGVLPTDSEIELKLRRADEYVSQGRFDLAAVIWQNVLDMSSTALRSADGRQFTSVQYHVEQQLTGVARTNPAGLNAYRIKADGSALGLIAAAKSSDNDNEQEQKLAEVVRRFFFSSHGDEAAYTLGCLMLDRFEFISASRLFGKLIDQHPDYMAKATGQPFAARGEVLLRLAIAHARTGDSKAALSTISLIEKEASLDVTPGMLAMVKREVEAGHVDGHDPAAVSEGSWPLAHGTSSRDGYMTGLPEDTEYKGVWRERWVAHFPSASTQNHTQRESIRYKWVARSDSTGDWTPSGHMLLHDGRVYFKGYKQLVCVDAASGKLQWRSRESEPYVQPLNQTAKEEILLFGDRTRTEFAIDRGVVYYYEDDTNQTIKSSNSQQFRGNASPMMSAYPDRYGNKLVALDAETGKLLWDFATDKDAEGNVKALRFTAAPTPAGGLLMVPAYDGTSHWMYALKANSDAGSNRVVWRTLLCDDPTGGVSPWQTVGVSVGGGDVYVCNGTGWVFNLDAASGHVRWAVPYARNISHTSNQYNRSRSVATPMAFDVNTVVPVGRHLIVMASDVAEPSSDFDFTDNVGIFSLDRRTGRKLWHAPRDGANQYLGVHDDGLFVAGTDFVIKYSIASRQGSRLAKNVNTGRITGRGFIASDGVYLPTYDQSASVLRLDTESLKPKSRVGVRLTVKNAQGEFAYFDPIGNLLSDGERLYGLGLERAYSMRHGTTKVVSRVNTPSPVVRKDDDKPTITGANDSETLRLHGIEENVESFREYFASLHPTDAQKKKFAALIKQLGDQAFDKRESAERTLRTLPVVPVEMLNQAVTDATDPETVSRAKRVLLKTSGQRERVLNSAFRVIAEKKIKGLGKETLAASAMCTEGYLLVSARRALVETATATDVPALQEAMKNGSAEKRIIAAAAIGSVLGEKAVPDLDALFKDKNPKVQIAAARSLADMGHRGSLDKFIALMNNDDVYVRSDAANSLRALTGQRFSFIAYEKQELRDAALKKWKDWIAGDGKTAKLTYPLSKSRFMLGRTLIANYTASRVYEIDIRTGKETWSTTVTRPWVCYGTPQGHRIATSYTSRAVYEFDAQGKKIWEVSNLPTYPQGVERLENGNTLVACSSSNRVLEIRPDKSNAWDKTFNRRPTSASRLANGNTLITLQSNGAVTEVDRNGKTVWEITGLSSPISSSRLPNGNTLVCEVSGRRVREYSPDKKIVWDSSQHNVVLQSPICAQRLENGHTLISDYKGIYEVDPKGKIVWKKLETGIRGFHRY